MAPTTKDAENSAESSSLATPVSGAPKTADGSTRTQPVALEIPVTVNGARTVEGSDKREPFSEATKTVLIFNQGAVIRIATPVAAGQLVFLTNEKSKKEVVCQVVKSKPGGGPGAGYVELQFTEPAVGFWGLRFPAAPGAPAAPSAAVPAAARATTPAATATRISATAQVPPASTASRSAAPAASVPVPAPKAAPPVPPVAPKPVAPTLSAPPPPKPAAAPPAPPVVKTEAPQSLASPTPLSPAPASFAPPPAPLPPVAAPAPPEEKRGRGIPEIHDYSKEIAAIFAVPPVGSSQTATTSPAPPQPSTEEIKQQAARLQVQLGSMLFSESAAAPSAPPTVTPSASNAKSPATGNVGSVAADSAQKVAEAKPQDGKPAAKPLPKPVSTAPKAKSYDIEQVEEVKVPDWLAPLSRNAESAPAPTPPPSAAAVPSEQSRIPGWLSPLSHIAPPALTPAAVPTDVATISASPAEPAESHSVPAVEAEANSHDEPFGGRMLDDSLESSPEASTAGSSKKGLFLGLAAAALLLAGGGIWYMRQTRGVNSGGPTVKVVEAPVPSQTVVVSSLPTTKPEPAAVPTGSNSPAAIVSPVSPQPAKNSTANVLSAAPATAPKNTAPLVQKEAPVEQPKKPSLGEVHLSAPLVSRVHVQQGGEADPSLNTGVPTPGAESLSSLSGSTKEPSAPLPVGGDVKPAHLIKSVPPVYPPVARTQRIAGSVSIDAVVDTEGNVSTMKVLSGPAILHRAALDAVKQWHYEPAMLDGKPTASHLTVIVQFRLQ